MKTTKRFLALVLTLCMVLSLMPTVAFAADTTLTPTANGEGDENEGLIPDENGVLAEATDVEVNSGEGYDEDNGKHYNERIDLTYTATEDGIITLTMGAADPGWGYQIASPEEAASLMKTGTAETVVPVNLYAGETFSVSLYAYDKEKWSVTNGRISYKLTFQAADLPDKVVEKETYIVSDTALSVGDNTLTLDESAVTTIYEFMPEKAGTYTITGPAAAIVGNWGGFGNLTDPQNDTNSIEWDCASAGQPLYVGVSDVEGAFNLNVTLTQETQEIVTKWDKYYNKKIPLQTDFKLELGENQKAAFVDITEEHSAVEGKDGYFHLDSEDGPILYADLVNPNWSLRDVYYGSMPAITLRGYEEDDEGNITKRYDFRDAMFMYVEAMDDEGYYPLTKDLILFLKCFGNAQGWWMKGMSPFEAVNEGTVNENSERALAMCVTVENPTELGAGQFPVSGDLYAGETDYYLAYKMADTIITIKGDVTVTVDGKTYQNENGVTTVYVDAPSPFVHVAIAVCNEGEEDAQYTISLSSPLGSQNNPAELKLGENTVDIEEGDDNGYWYAWTATEDGILEITMDTQKNWSYSVKNNTSYSSTEIRTSADDEVYTSDFVEVKKGDEVRVMVTTFDAKNPYTAPAGTITITAATEHNFKWETVKEATETEEGLKKGTCGCGETEEETIAKIPCPTAQYTDVNHAADCWYHADLDWMVSNGYMKGVSDTEMRPDAQLSRAQLVQMLYNIEGRPSVEGLEEPFADVNGEHWFYAAIVWAYNNEIVNGTSDTTFDPDANITREQVAAILYRYAGFPKVKGDLSAYADAARVNPYAVDALVWATENGIINGIRSGDVTNLAPRPVNEEDKNDTVGLATRAQAAVMLSRYLQK